MPGTALHDVLTHLNSGHNITVGEAVSGDLSIKVTGIGIRNQSADLVMPAFEIGRFTQAASAAICQLLTNGSKVAFYMDYYGRQWIEVRSGLFMHRKQRLVMPAAVIDVVKSAVRAARQTRRPRRPVEASAPMQRARG